MKKQNIMPVAVLTVICLVVALLLAGVNFLTAPIIKEREEQKKFDSLRDALDGTFEDFEIPEGAPETVKAMYKVSEDGGLKGYVVLVEVKGYAGPISMTVGVLGDGTVNKVIVTRSDETHGKAGMADYPDQFADVSKDKVADVELFAGATISSTAIKGGVIDAVSAVTGEGSSSPEGGEAPETLPKTDEEILALAAELLGVGADSLTNITPENTDTVKRVYRDKANKNYAVYTVVMSQYGTVETETLIHIDFRGTVKGIKKFTWKTSDAMYGYVPPTQEEADVFYNNVVGAGIDSIDGIDAVTNATNTTNSLKAAIKEAINTVKEDYKKLELPRTDEEIITLAAELLGVGADKLAAADADNAEFVKRIYRDKAGKNYAVYTVVMSQYGTVETETLIHIDFRGTVKGIKKLTWKTSDAMYGYVPPTQEEADVFYNNVVGAGIDSIDGIDAVTNATNTTNSLKAAIKEAIGAVEADYEEPPIWRIIGILILSAAALSTAAAVIITKKRRAVK